MSHAKDPSADAEKKAAEFDKSYADSQARAAQRDPLRPAPLPTNPKTGSDAPDDGS